VIIGSACIVLVVTIALIGRNYVLAQIEGVGSNLVYAYYSGDTAARNFSDEISLADLKAVRQLPHVVEAAGTDDMSGLKVVVDGKERAVSLVGVTEGFQKIRNLLILQGRYFDEADMQSAAKGCLITQDLARQFRFDMVGKSIRIGELQFTVIGVFRERVATFGQSEITSESVLIPFPLFKTYRGSEFIRTLYAQADSAQNVSLATAEIQHLLQSRHRPGVVYTVQNLSSILDAARKISMALTIVLLMVGTIALIISGVGIMNIMLVTVTERTKEIGLRKAVGARRSEILYQFLIEAFLISGIGAFIGIFLAIGVKIVLEPLLPAEYNIHIPISVASIIVSFTVSCAIGVLFGYLPASRASRLQPTEALHFE